MIGTVHVPNWTNPLEDIQRIIAAYGKRPPRRWDGSLPIYKVEDLPLAIEYLSTVLRHLIGDISTAEWEVNTNNLDYGFYTLTVHVPPKRLPNDW